MARQRPSGWWYPWLFVAGMLIVVAVNGVLIAYAIGTFPGLTTEDAYRKGLAYNRTLAAADAQAARGWHLELTMQPATPGGGGTVEADAAGGRTAVLAARFTEAAGQPLTGLQVQAILERPVGVAGGLTVDLAAAGDGVYRVTLALPDAGQWQVRVLARRGDETFQESRRFLLP
jgi:nitrogen fixation protein FixH